METHTTKVMSCRQLVSKSSRRPITMAATDSTHGWSRVGPCDHHFVTKDVWSTDSSRRVVDGEKSRSRSAEARPSPKCRACGGNESMETLDVRLLSPDSGAIVFNETPDNELATTTSTTPDWSNEVSALKQIRTEWLRCYMLCSVPSSDHFKLSIF